MTGYPFKPINTCIQNVLGLCYVWTTLLLAACSSFDKKAATKANFRPVVEKAIAKQVQCFQANIPSDSPIFFGRPFPIQQLETLVTAGLATRAEAVISIKKRIRAGRM